MRRQIAILLVAGFLVACGSDQEGVDYTGEGQPIKCMDINSCSEPASLACQWNQSICGCNGETQEQIDNKCKF